MQTESWRMMLLNTPQLLRHWRVESSLRCQVTCTCGECSCSCSESYMHNACGSSIHNLQAQKWQHVASITTLMIRNHVNDTWQWVCNQNLTWFNTNFQRHVFPGYPLHWKCLTISSNNMVKSHFSWTTFSRNNANKQISNLNKVLKEISY